MAFQGPMPVLTLQSRVIEIGRGRSVCRVKRRSRCEEFGFFISERRLSFRIDEASPAGF